MGKTRLSVAFDNGHVGKFLDWRDADIHTPNDVHNETPTINTNHVSCDNDDIAQLTDLLEHMAFTAATIISSKHDDPSHMQQLLESFNRSVCVHADTLAVSHRQLRSSNRSNNSTVPDAT
jgi:hypothetical protein